jgi:hypothetical protein
VGRDAELARVGEAVPAAEHLIRVGPELGKRGEQGGNLAEGQEPRGRRESAGAHRPSPFDLGHLQEAVNDHSCDGKLSLQVEREVGASDAQDAGRRS